MFSKKVVVATLRESYGYQNLTCYAENLRGFVYVAFCDNSEIKKNIPVSLYWFKVNNGRVQICLK